MSFDYAGLQTRVQTIVDRFDQGDIYYVPQGAETSDPWDPQPEQGEPVKIDAVAFGVSKQYIDESISASDIEVTASVWSTVPELSGQIQIGDKLHEIIRIKRIPEAGIVVAWQIFVKS